VDILNCFGGFPEDRILVFKGKVAFLDTTLKSGSQFKLMDKFFGQPIGKKL